MRRQSSLQLSAKIASALLVILSSWFLLCGCRSQSIPPHSSTFNLIKEVFPLLAQYPHRQPGQNISCGRIFAFRIGHAHHAASTFNIASPTLYIVLEARRQTFYLIWIGTWDGHASQNGLRLSSSAWNSRIWNHGKVFASWWKTFQAWQKSLQFLFRVESLDCPALDSVHDILGVKLVQPHDM